MTAPPTIQTNPLDPVFSGVPVTFPQTGTINPTWNKWFTDLREKVNVINQTLATLSGGSIDPSTGALAISSGGTGATTVAGAQVNLGILANPMTAAGDIIIGGISGTPTRLAKGTNGYVLTLVSGVPAWVAGGGGGGGYSPGTPPTIVQFAYNTSGVSATLGATPTPGNLLVALTCNSTSNSLASGWTKNVENTTGTDWGNVCTKVAGSGESTTQGAMSTATTSGGVVIYELSKASGTVVFLTGNSQPEVTASITTVILYPNLTNVLSLSFCALVGSSVTFTNVYNIGMQDVLSNTGNRRIACGHYDLSISPMAGLIATLSASGNSKGMTALFA